MEDARRGISWLSYLREDCVRQNVTLSLPQPLLRRFRVYAARRNQSMTKLMTEAIKRIIDEGNAGDAAKRRFLARIRNAPDRDTHGVIPWTRNELHEH